jgi:hypothetical protein
MSWKFPDNPKEYGILYAKPSFPKGSKLEWLNYTFLHIKKMPKDLSQRVEELVSYINNKYFDKIIIPLDYKTQPGLVCDPDVIEEIANLVYEGFNQIIKDLTGFEKSYILVWSIGEMEQPEELIRQGKRVSGDVPTLHNIDPYNIVVKVGHKLDSTKEPGIYKV